MPMYTVIGAYDGDELLIVGAVEGVHQVGGDMKAVNGLEPWADHVDASSAQEACEKAREEHP